MSVGLYYSAGGMIWLWAQPGEVCINVSSIAAVLKKDGDPHPSVLTNAGIVYEVTHPDMQSVEVLMKAIVNA